MTDLQTKIYNIIKDNKEGIFTADIAKIIYSKVRKDLRPINQNNSIICAIREIERKYPNHIQGYNRGSKGKLFYINKLPNQGHAR